MADMTVKEFVEKIIKDKAFRIDVVNHCYDAEPPQGDENGRGIWLNTAAERMGYEFDSAEVQKEVLAQLKKLNLFKKIAVIGSLLNNANKAKKAAQAGK